MARLTVLGYGPIDERGQLRMPQGYDACFSAREIFARQRQRDKLFDIVVASRSSPAVDTACLITDRERPDGLFSERIYYVSFLDDLLVRKEVKQYGDDIGYYLPRNQEVMGRGLSTGKNLQVFMARQLQRLQTEEQNRQQEQEGLVIIDELVLMYFGVRLSLAPLQFYGPLSGYEISGEPQNAAITPLKFIGGAHASMERGRELRRNLQEIA